MSQQIQVNGLQPKEPINQGASNDSVIDSLRRFLNPQFRLKTAWEALIAAIAAGDQIVRDNAYKAFDQLFLSTASGQYLIKKAADYGIRQPDIGISDSVFRKLAVSLNARKLVHQALLGILETFYGQDATHANVTTGTAEPYNLTNNDYVVFRFDDRTDVTATFLSEDFSTLSAATASEIAAVFTRAFRNAGLTAYALAKSIDGANKVVVYSGALGLLGSIKVTGGLANNILQFPTRIPLFTALPAPAPSWAGLRVSEDEFRFTWNQAAYNPTNLANISVGDWVIIDSVNAPLLRGFYEVSVVHIDVNPGTGAALNYTWFSIKPSSAVKTAYPLSLGITFSEAAVNDIVFFRPNRITVINSVNPSFISQHQEGLDILFPATTQTVNRTNKTAAYPQSATEIPITSAVRSTTDILIVTSQNHGLSLGQLVSLYDTEPDRSFTAGAFTYPQSGRWDEWGQVTNIVSPTSFRMATQYPVSGRAAGGYAVAFKGPSGSNQVGPYVYEPQAGLGITSTSTTSTQSIAGGRGVSSLAVASAASFPEGGYLVFGFGTDQEIGPVPFYGKTDATHLKIDGSFVFPDSIASGFDVTLLVQKGPWAPETPASVGSFYLTASTAGRTAAQGYINEVVAAGVNVNEIISYPGDRGLAGQGLPTTGQKVSDKVMVWAGDDADIAVSEAHNG